LTSPNPELKLDDLGERKRKSNDLEIGEEDEDDDEDGEEEEREREDAANAAGRAVAAMAVVAVDTDLKNVILSRLAFSLSLCPLINVEFPRF